MSEEIVPTRSRPELAEVTGLWRWEQFFSRHGRSLDSVLDAEREAARTSAALPVTLVLLADGEPAGMASLADRDSEQWLDLSPWLAGVYVPAQFRNRGHATRLVAAVEAAARRGGFGAAWLYTRTAEGLYRRCGWRDVEPFARNGQIYTLMRRDLAPADPADLR